MFAIDSRVSMFIESWYTFTLRNYLEYLRSILYHKNRLVNSLSQHSPMSCSSATRQLSILFRVTTGMCLFMLFWIFVFPSSGVQGGCAFMDKLRSPKHIPPLLIEKFKGQYAVHWTHTFPSAIWSAFVPFQIHPGFRHRNRRLHRIMGYTFMAMSAIIMVGVVIIFQRDLLFIKFLRDVPAGSFLVSEIAIVLMGAWFLWTAVMAMMEVRSRRFAEHQFWIVRHIGSGIWVAVMRILIILVKPFFDPPFHHGSVTQMTQGKVFSYACCLGMLIAVCTSEYAIRLLKLEESKKNL
jgi:hypothetical protein